MKTSARLGSLTLLALTWVGTLGGAAAVQAAPPGQISLSDFSRILNESTPLPGGCEITSLKPVGSGCTHCESGVCQPCEGDETSMLIYKVRHRFFSHRLRDGRRARIAIQGPVTFDGRSYRVEETESGASCYFTLFFNTCHLKKKNLIVKLAADGSVESLFYSLDRYTRSNAEGTVTPETFERNEDRFVCRRD